MTTAKAYTEVTARILQKLEEGTAPWRRPWRGGLVRPRNLDTGKAYRGINTLMLGLVAGGGYFATRKQGERLGGTLRAEAQGWPVMFYRSLTRTDTNAETDEQTEKTVPVVQLSTVYNVRDFEGLTDPTAGDVEERDLSPIDTAQAIAEGWKDRPAIEHNEPRAYYVPAKDRINVPRLGLFDDAAHYYATLFHELGHATGHESRLRRDLSGLMGGHSYSREELIAEMTSAFLCCEAGISCAPLEDNAAAYLAHWLQALKGSPALVVQAAGAAQKAADLILGRTHDADDVTTSAEARREIARLRDQNATLRARAEVAQ